MYFKKYLIIFIAVLMSQYSLANDCDSLQDSREIERCYETLIPEYLALVDENKRKFDALLNEYSDYQMQIISADNDRFSKHNKCLLSNYPCRIEYEKSRAEWFDSVREELDKYKIQKAEEDKKSTAVEVDAPAEIKNKNTVSEVDNGPQEVPPPPMVSEDNSLAKKISLLFDSKLMRGVLVIVLLSPIVAFVLHRKLVLDVYSNYTDALVTNAYPLILLGVVVVSFVLGKLVEFVISDSYISQVIAVVFGVAVSIYIGYVILRETYIGNGIGWRFFISLSAKVMFMLIFYLTLIFLFNRGDSRYKDEAEYKYRARVKREDADNFLSALVATSLFGYLLSFICRDSDFVPLSEYLSPSRGTKKQMINNILNIYPDCYSEIIGKLPADGNGEIEVPCYKAIGIIVRSEINKKDMVKLPSSVLKSLIRIASLDDGAQKMRLEFERGILINYSL